MFSHFLSELMDLSSKENVLLFLRLQQLGFLLTPEWVEDGFLEASRMHLLIKRLGRRFML